jgi:hypothetical protein
MHVSVQTPVRRTKRLFTSVGSLALIFLVGLLMVVYVFLPLWGNKLQVIQPVYTYIGGWLVYTLLLVFIKRDYSAKQIVFLLSFILFFSMVVPLGLFLTMSRERLLYYSASFGHTTVLRLLLLKSNPDEINEVLVDAAMGGQAEIVRDMLQRGAPPNARFMTTPAIIFAVGSGSTETVKLLIDYGADVNLQDDEGQTALMLATITDRPEMVKLLIRAKADLSIKNKRGETALSISESFRRDDIAEMLKATAANNSPASSMLTPTGQSFR